ncbi:Arabinoxylan arabinofuranohydrolase [Escovopsis weberi]|uniref:Arabinoxylan arabinofuranohydrolase n=1 Tax=Escovopsis weberi TaxID=150374 RepID=A0A0N0RTW8_ESCWE|nr:Arabinoxylan arabinofuranohydrolase [Escovopsis weberi]
MPSAQVVLTALLAASPAPDFATSEAGNPFVRGRYADPDTQHYNGEYWVFPTSSLPYDQQTYLDAFSSPDLVHWTKHANVLDAHDFSWAHRAVWAPAPVERNGTYYLYFAANDIQEAEDNAVGGIGVGVADRPEGPYRDPLGRPLIGAYHNGAQPIDQDVFVDDDGQAYIYYGGHSHANVARLNADMISLGTFEDGSTFREITPEHYVEGPQMLKHRDVYYLFWSEGGWGGPDYAVAYAMASSPVGPFERVGRILQQDAAVATGSGHNAVIHVPDTDIYYMLYHRHPLGATDQNDRHLAYDRLRFNEDGTIQPVGMLVRDGFQDGQMFNWEVYGGAWDAQSCSLHADSDPGGKALLNTNFSDFIYEADITIPHTRDDTNAGLIFRVTEPHVGPDAYRGYYAGIDVSSRGLVIGRADAGGWTWLGGVSVDARPGNKVHLTVKARGDLISVSVDDVTANVRDRTYASGQNGVRVYNTEAVFDNIDIRHFTEQA